MTTSNVATRRRDVAGYNNSYANWIPAVDITEDETKFALSFDLPGLKKENIKVNVKNDVLTVEGERENIGEVKSGYYYRHERKHGSFSRTFSLPDNVAGEDLKAVYKDGVLNLELPKKEEAKPVSIVIK